MLERIGELFGILAAGLPLTASIAVMALIIGALCGLPVMFLRRSRSAIAKYLGIAVIDVIRAVPPLVWIFLVFFGLPRMGLSGINAAVAATVALGLVSTASLAEIYRAAFDAVPKGQSEAASAIALGSRDQFVKILAPQAIPMIIPPAVTFAVGMIKETALASIIGVAEVTFRAYLETQRSFEGMTVFSVAAIMYLIISTPLVLMARQFEKSLPTPGRS